MENYYKLQLLSRDTVTEIPLLRETSQSFPVPRAFLSLKPAGNMAFSKQHIFSYRNNLFNHLHIQKTKVYSLYQNHTMDVVMVDKNNKPDFYHKMIGDGLITGERDLILSITVADCLPIFLIDKKNGAYGIVHSGWKGTGIILNAISFMEECYRTRRRDLKIIIGPGIGPCCYNVPHERYTAFSSNFGENSVREDDENYYLNLQQANINILNNNGISDIDVITNCTSCTPMLHSFRRDGMEGYGLMMAFIGYF